MEHSVYTTGLDNMPTEHQNSMFRLRYEVFAERLGWDVKAQNGLERDVYDELDRASYIVARSEHEDIDACWRLLPSTGPYMLKDTFPELLHGELAPQAPDVWELSRFAVATDRVETAGGQFGPLSVALFRQLAQFAVANGVSRYVTVTTLPIERLMKRQKLNVRRLGPPVKIGIVYAVALFIEVTEESLAEYGVQVKTAPELLS